MKLFLAILFLLALPVVAKPQAVKPRTAQQEAELRDWIIGIQNIAEQAVKDAHAAEAEAQASRAQSAIAGTKIEEANVKLVTIQGKYDAMELERDKAVEHDKKTTALCEKFATAIGVEFAVILLLVCLKLGVPAMFPPWGIVATCALPVIALGVIKLLPHVQ